MCLTPERMFASSTGPKSHHEPASAHGAGNDPGLIGGKDEDSTGLLQVERRPPKFRRLSSSTMTLRTTGNTMPSSLVDAAKQRESMETGPENGLRGASRAANNWKQPQRIPSQWWKFGPREARRVQTRKSRIASRPPTARSPAKSTSLTGQFQGESLNDGLTIGSGSHTLGTAQGHRIMHFWEGNVFKSLGTASVAQSHNHLLSCCA